MIDFKDFRHSYIEDNLLKLYLGKLDVTIFDVVCNANIEEIYEFNECARDLWSDNDGFGMDILIEKLAIEYLSSEAETEYKNMIAAAEDEAGAERAFYNMHR